MYALYPWSLDGSKAAQNEPQRACLQFKFEIVARTFFKAFERSTLMVY